ncbi:hypothetical protein [Paenarthrobacter ureafaciens]|uniref:hypothetical protein n=1 Tax=Paenarthrobacter ureafaciens TaxID=37931 RepID=UPI0034638C9F
MAEETDGIEEALEGQIRVLVTAAGQVGERIARAREAALRRAQAASEQEARELQSRLAAEQRAARTELGNVHRSDWWDRATPEQIGHTYQVARAWANEDPEAVRAEQRMRDELRTRYGVDVNNAGADPEAVRQAVQRELDRAERDRVNADAERSRVEQENAEAQRLMSQADQDDRRAEEARSAVAHEPDPEERIRAAAEAEQREAYADRARQDGRTQYDSAERREGTARDLEAKGINHDVIATRMRADISQGKPATEAVKNAGKTKAPEARKAAHGRDTQMQHTGLGR